MQTTGLRLTLVVFCALISMSLFAQHSLIASDERIDADSLYILNYSDLLSVKLFGIVKSNRISHIDNFTKRRIDYKPNETFNLGIGVTHKWLALDLAINFPFINDDDELFGKTERLDFQANIYLRRFTIDLNFQKYKGYYGSNPGSYKPDFDISMPVYPLRPDISTFNLEASILHVFKPDKLSYRAAFVYNERQLKSAGSWLAGTYISYFSMDADSTLIPAELQSEFNPDADFRKIKYIDTGISGGYGHSFVIAKKYYFSITLAVGLGPSIKKIPIQGSSQTLTEVRPAARAINRIALGYNSDKSFGGLSFVISTSSQTNEEEARLLRSVQNFKIFYGKRFATPKIFKRKTKH